MTKTVVETPMVAHLWVHKSQEYATNKYRNFYFRGDTIYSYGSHFPVARYVTRKGKQAILITTCSYSVTTKKHKRIVEDACCHLTVFHVTDVNYTEPSKQVGDYRARYMALVNKYAKARQRRPEHLGALSALVNEANDYARFFGLQTRLILPNDLTAMIAECKTIEKKERERKQRESRKREQEAQKRLHAWMNCETYYPPIHDGKFAMLRIVGDTLETSKGAHVPLDHAIKAFRILKRLRDKGQVYERYKHAIHLGHFVIDAVDGAGNVQAGCHEVTWEEIKRVAKLAGVL